MVVEKITVKQINKSLLIRAAFAIIFGFYFVLGIIFELTAWVFKISGILALLFCVSLICPVLLRKKAKKGVVKIKVSKERLEMGRKIKFYLLLLNGRSHKWLPHTKRTFFNCLDILVPAVFMIWF